MVGKTVRPRAGREAYAGVMVLDVLNDLGQDLAADVGELEGRRLGEEEA